MELIENLLQLLVTFVGALLSGILPEKPQAGVFPAAVLLRLLCPRCALLDAVPAAVRYHAAGLLCVGVRLGGQRNFPAHFAGHAHQSGRAQLPLPQGMARACVRRAAAGVLLHLRGHSLQPDLVRHDDWLSFCAIRGLVYAKGRRRARRGICGTSISACCALRSRSICSGRRAASGRIPPASPTFWCDLLLTLAILGLLPATRKAVEA